MKKFYSILGLAAITSVAVAQTSIPVPIETIDFEGISSASDLGGEQVGKGEFVVSDDINFGTYYQNNPDGELKSHTNYLIIPTKGFVKSQAKSDEQFSIAFWINGYVANEKQGVDAAGHYYSTAIAAYSSVNSYKTFSWPMFSARTRRTLQINCNGWSDYTDIENVNGKNVESNEWIWTKQIQEGDSLVNTSFEDNWHYVTITFNGLNAKYYVDGEIMNEWNATANSYYFVKAMNALDAIYLGDCGPFWQDKDGAYAYDDISLYATELQQDQIDIIMRMKKNELSDDDKLAVAQYQLVSLISDVLDYVYGLDETFSSLKDNTTDRLNAIEPSDCKTIEEINTVIAEVNALYNGVSEIVNCYGKAKTIIDNGNNHLNATSYPGSDEYMAAIEAALAAINDPLSTEQINNAIVVFNQAKIKYLFSQEGDVKNITRAISVPWFVEEAYEPTVGEDGSITFPDEAKNKLSKDNWTMSFSDNLKGSTDCTIYFTNGRSTANLFHNSTVADGVLNLQQTITGLPAGFYDVAADMSSSSAPTNNHLYATSAGVTKVSSVPYNLSFGGDAVADWTPLTTDKVRVGEDGTLTLGATSTTDGTQYKGWFCVTNFQLRYYGTEYDMSADLTAKEAEVREAIESLILKGDKAYALADLEATLQSDATDYDKVSHLTDLLALVKSYAEKEAAFIALDNIIALREMEGISATQKTIFSVGAEDIKVVINADTTTVFALPGLNQLYNAYVSYASVAKSAENWGTDAATAELNSQVAALKGSTVESLAEKKAKLVEIMKSSITDFDASEAEPKDITGLVVNPSFDGDSDAGWTITGTHANWYSECEFYNTAFDIHQVIEGLPAGSYRVAVQGYYRDGGRDEAVAHYHSVDSLGNNGYIANATLYANVQSAKMISMASDSIVGDNIETVHPDGTTYAWYQPNAEAELENMVSYPDGMNAAQFCFDRGMYAGNSVNVVLSEGESLKFGIAKTETIQYDWTIFDNFKLYYIGQDIPAAIETATSAALATPAAIYTLSGTRVNSMVKGINIVKMSDGTVRKVMVK